MKGRGDISFLSAIFRWDAALLVLLCGVTTPATLRAGGPSGPEATLRVIVAANAARDLATMSNTCLTRRMRWATPSMGINISDGRPLRPTCGVSLAPSAS